MSTDEPDHGGDVLDSWEELEDTSVLDKKLKEIKISSTEERRLHSQAMVTDSSDRTQYQPQVKILKRQTESSAVSSDQRSNKQPTKTLEQREAEYAEARLRILGPTYKNSEDSPNVEEGMAEESVTQLFKELNANNNCVPILRQPKGPDGSMGFDMKR